MHGQIASLGYRQSPLVQWTIRMNNGLAHTSSNPASNDAKHLPHADQVPNDLPTAADAVGANSATAIVATASRVKTESGAARRMTAVPMQDNAKAIPITAYR